MINSTLSQWLGIAFVLVGAINVLLILQSSARLKNTKASARLIGAHRIGGYVFIGLFSAMTYYMVSRLDEISKGASAGAAIHMTLAMILSPLLFVKVVVARYYRNYYSILLPLGLVIFVLSFVLIGIAVGPSLVHQARMQTVSLASIDLPPAPIDLDMAAKRMEERCSKCHNLDRIAGAHKDARGWFTTVNRMRALPDSGISAGDARIIVAYLTSQMGPKGPPAAANREIGRALVDQRCGRCHSLDRVYKTAESPEEWRATVARMVAYAAGSVNAFQTGEDEQILGYLSVTQTPDALNDRHAQAAAASSAGKSLVEEKAAAPEEPAAPARSAVTTFGSIGLACSILLVLIFRRPGKASAASVPAEPRAGTAVSSLADPFILKLAAVTQQTHDTKTLRFILPHGRTINSRPGQFMTFSFLFSGRKVVRSYTICSSAARSAYVEITPKRNAQGCASVFLNDRAAVGLTVEATGPFGQFYLDEQKHRKIVLLAGGSGITPMVAMLRYIDDLCLEISATLLYCVRTKGDIIFENELEQLRSRIAGFQYRVSLSQPDAAWTGDRGRVSREFIERAVEDPAGQDFFLCGPPAFMDASRGILIDLGVKPERIRQESFGAPPAASISALAQPETDIIIEFARSGKTCTLRSGQTLLEAAEEHGVPIPFSCRQGQCGTCKTKLLAGSVSMSAEEGLDADSRAQGFVLTCVGRAQGAVKLDR